MPFAFWSAGLPACARQLALPTRPGAADWPRLGFARPARRRDRVASATALGAQRFIPHDDTAPLVRRRVVRAAPVSHRWLHSAHFTLQGGARGSRLIKRIGCRQAGHTGGGAGAAWTTAGARQSSSAPMRSHLALAAAARHP